MQSSRMEATIYIWLEMRCRLHVETAWLEYAAFRCLDVKIGNLLISMSCQQGRRLVGISTESRGNKPHTLVAILGS